MEWNGITVLSVLLGFHNAQVYKQMYSDSQGPTVSDTHLHVFIDVRVKDREREISENDKSE